jgi:hypothetical protein
VIACDYGDRLTVRNGLSRLQDAASPWRPWSGAPSQSFVPPVPVELAGLVQ